MLLSFAIMNIKYLCTLHFHFVLRQLKVINIKDIHSIIFVYNKHKNDRTFKSYKYIYIINTSGNEYYSVSKHIKLSIT